MSGNVKKFCIKKAGKERRAGMKKFIDSTGKLR
jgi:hypothetical protein